MYTNIIIKSPKDLVEKELLSFFEKNGAIISSTKIESFFRLGSINEGTTMIDTNHQPMPKLITDLSKNLNTKVITLGYASINSAVHYSEVENGEVKKVYTYSDGLVENKNLDLADVYKTATSKKQFKSMPGFDPSTATEQDLETQVTQDHFGASSEFDFSEAFDSVGVDNWDTIYVDTSKIREYYDQSPSDKWEDLL